MEMQIEGLYIFNTSVLYLEIWVFSVPELDIFKKNKQPGIKNTFLIDQFICYCKDIVFF